MITTKNFTAAYGVTVTVKYPTGTIFMRERNYLTVSCEADDYYLKRITLAGKTINFGRYYLFDGPITLDVTPYYAKLYNNNGTLSLVVENQDEVDETFTVSFTIDKVDGYSPFLEFVPERCGDAPYARIVPPNRMLWDGTKKSKSLLAAVRNDDYFSGYEYEMEGVPYATYRPSDAWLTTTQKNAHLGETYRNTLPATGNLAELDSNGNPMWIEQGYLTASGHAGKSFEEQRTNQLNFCRTKTIFKNYNGLTIGAPPAGYQYGIWFYNSNKKFVSTLAWITEQRTLNNASSYPYIALTFRKANNKNITPSELVGITSSTLTNPEAGKSYRWVEQNGVFSWLELTEEQIVNNSFYWNIYTDDTNIPKNVDLVNEAFVFSKTFEAYYVRIQSISPTDKRYYRVASVKRVVSLADGSTPYVYIRWKTPWGVTVEHLFYLGSYSSDKADAKELESLNYYEELSNHVRVGSFYLDGITQPYDLFYYKTLENAELVEMYFPSYAFKPSTYMPNGDDYVAIKIKGSDVAEAVVDGIAQRVITFKFELS